MKRLKIVSIIALLVLVCACIFAACEGGKATVTLDAGEGTCSVTEMEAVIGSRCPPPPSAEREGYLFTGWYTDAGERYSFTEKVKGDMTLHARFTAQANDFISVVYSTGENEALSRKVKKGSLLPVPDDPVRENYRFDGWFKDAEFTEQWDFTKDTLDEPVTLYAKWTALYTVKIMSESEQLSSAVYASGEPLDGAIAVSGETVYEGLYADALFTDAVSVMSPVTSDMTLYARLVKATPASAFVFEEYEYENGVYITGLAEDFKGSEIVIPETIKGKPVLEVTLEYGKHYDRVVVSSSVRSLYGCGGTLDTLVISPSNRYFKMYDGCLYRKDYYSYKSAFYLSEIPDEKAVVNVMPGASLVMYDYYRTYVLFDEAWRHEDDVFTQVDVNLVVPDEYYDDYAAIVYEVGKLHKMSEFDGGDANA